MKDTGKNLKQVEAFQKYASEATDAYIATGKKTREQSIHELEVATCKLTGTTSLDVANRIMTQVANAQVWPKPNAGFDQRIKAFSGIAEMDPRNATEAMLATQMIGVHEAAMMFLHRATLVEQSPEGIDPNVLRATRLLRLFTEQLEAMAKLKGKSGQQRVTVEHVHVHPGGQAIVGAVSTGKGTRGRGDG